MFAEFLLEIGTEEIPAGYLKNALKDLGRLAEIYLSDNRIEMKEDFLTFGTPRRLVLIAKAVSDRQADMTQSITGPPKKAAFDNEGNPTKAALGFAKKQGVSLDNLDILETPKGEYLYIQRKIPGKATIEILTEILPRLISDITWPKSMRWGSESFSFVRPVHWILALFNGNVIPFEIAGVKSADKTRGHRFMKPQAMKIKDSADYMKKMRESYVVINQDERERAVEQAVTSSAQTVSGAPIKDPELMVTVANLVEFPSAVCGSFDRAFLEIPDPVLITAMREHQKYFSLYDKDGRLMPNFVAVNNTLANEPSMVCKGHERVLRARLADADFFFKEDRKRPLQSRLEDLKGVIYQAELGTSFSKIQRFTKVAEHLTRQVAPELLDHVTLTAQLCKCDLVTEMVMEFPTLQGVMGKEYARLDGHPEEVCLGIHEHYLPSHAGDNLPESLLGAIVGVADRIDTIAGCFATGQEPTGTTDPFALRRHALAVIRIIESRAWDISIQEIISRSLAIIGESIDFDLDDPLQKVAEFFRDRYKNLQLTAGYKSDLIEAVLSAGFDRIAHLKSIINQLHRFMVESSEFESLVLTFKRVSNILKKQQETYTVDPDLFEESCESKLWEDYKGVRDQAQGSIKESKYFEALNLMVHLRQPVDDLFDGVEILTKDERLRENRIGMLQNLSQFFQSIADFSKFSI